jgi:hypothetical protein
MVVRAVAVPMTGRGRQESKGSECMGGTSIC